MEVQEAYKVLGLSEGATKEEVEKRYAMLCKRYKTSLEDTSAGSEKINIQKINQAYDAIIHPLSQQAQNENAAVPANSSGSIWTRHRALIIGGIIVVVLILIFYLFS